MGIGLAPVLTELVLWSATHFQTAAPRAETRRMANDLAAFLKEIRRHWQAEREARPAARG
jgi:hypothetical protein